MGGCVDPGVDLHPLCVYDQSKPRGQFLCSVWCVLWFCTCAQNKLNHTGKEFPYCLMEAGLIATGEAYTPAGGGSEEPEAPVFKFALIEVGRSAKSGSTAEEKSKTGSVGPVLLFALIACIGGVLGGYSHGFPSPTLLELELAYERGERVTAFSSSSIYEGLFGVSCRPAPPTYTINSLFIIPVF